MSSLMTAMADAGEGNYYFIESPADLPRIFAQELAGLAGTLGTRVRLWLRPGDGSRAWLFNDLEQDPSGAYVLPNLVAGIPLEFLLELEARYWFTEDHAVASVRKCFLEAGECGTDRSPSDPVARLRQAHQRRLEAFGLRQDSICR